MRDVPDRLAQLDARRRWARARAPIWFGVGVAIVAVALAGTGLVVLAMLGRLVSLLLDRPLTDLPVWGWAGWIAASFAALGLLAAAGSVGLSVLRHGADRILRDVGAVRLDGEAASAAALPADADQMATTRLRNVVEALSLGVGIEAPALAVIGDPAPNALSVSGWRDETLVVTSGLLQIGRDELEAVAAHELAHLYARDTRWVTAAAASLGRVRGVAHLLEGFAGLLVLLFFLGVQADAFLATPLVGGLVIGGFALVVDRRVGSAQQRLRAESDEIADVAAVLLARNPAALASACAALSHLPRRVLRTSWRADHLWFAPLPEVKEQGSGGWRRTSPAGVDGYGPELAPGALEEMADVLTTRARAAYRAAGQPVPA